jgi:formiminoglutamase
MSRKKIGIINFDAHFDLREAEQVTSGTPFLNAAKLSEQNQKNFIICASVSRSIQTRKLCLTRQIA